MSEQAAEADHVLDTTVRPAACTCGRAQYAGSPTFVRERHAVHLEDVALRTSLGATS